MTTEVMLTTIDNPHDPFEDYAAWFAFDTQNGYHTAGFLARIATVSDDMSDADQRFALESAIDEIVELNVTGVFKKVVKEID